MLADCHRLAADGQLHHHARVVWINPLDLKGRGQETVQLSDQLSQLTKANTPRANRSNTQQPGRSNTHQTHSSHTRKNK